MINGTLQIFILVTTMHFLLSTVMKVKRTLLGLLENMELHH